MVFALLWLAASAAEGLPWLSLSEAGACALREQRPVLVYVHAQDCGPCRRMENEVFPEVMPLLYRFAPTRLALDDADGRVDWNGNVRSPAAWSRQLGASATPTFIFLNEEGEVIARAPGFMEAERFALLLGYVATGAFRHADFETYTRRMPPPNLHRPLEPSREAPCSGTVDAKADSANSTDQP